MISVRIGFLVAVLSASSGMALELPNGVVTITPDEAVACPSYTMELKKAMLVTEQSELVGFFAGALRRAFSGFLNTEDISAFVVNNLKTHRLANVLLLGKDLVPLLCVDVFFKVTGYKTIVEFTPRRGEAIVSRRRMSYQDPFTGAVLLTGETTVRQMDPSTTNYVPGLFELVCRSVELKYQAEMK